MIPKLFCPYCDLELSGNGHVSEAEAWAVFECEYDRRTSKKKPITELVRNKERLKELNERRNGINWSIRQIKARNLQLIELNEQ